MTALLIVLAIICFVMIHVTQHYNRKYRGMSDFSIVAVFVHTYWRTSRALPGLFYTGLYLCTWLIGRDFKLIQMAGMILLIFATFALVCMIIMCFVSLIETLFDSSKWSYQYDSIRRKYSEWCRDMKQEKKDMVCAFLVNTVALVLFMIVLTDSLRSIINL